MSRELNARTGEDTVEPRAATDSITDAPIELDGSRATQAEIDRARRIVAVLASARSHFEDAYLIAQTWVEQAELLGGPLADADAALAAAKTAFEHCPRALHVCAAYRRAALELDRWHDFVAACQAEAKAAEEPAYRSAIETARAIVLEAQLANPDAARATYLEALHANPANVIALAGLQRVASSTEDEHDVAVATEAMSNAIIDPEIGGEYLARAAAAFERVGAFDDALDAARRSLVLNEASWTAELVVERIAARRGDADTLVRLRRARIEDGLLDPALGWFHVGVLERYRLGSRARAKAAFARSVEAATDAQMRYAALSELVPILEADMEWVALVETELQRVDLCTSRKRRAYLWHRIGTIRLDRLVDDEGAAQAFAYALDDDPTLRPALESAARLHRRLDRSGDLAALHARQAEAAEDPAERDAASCRLGMMLVEQPDRVDDGIAALWRGLDSGNGTPGALSALERALTHREAWAELAELYRRELERCEDAGRRASLHLRLGILAVSRLDDPETARAAFEAAAELEGKQPAPEPLLRLVDLLDAAGDLQGLADALGRLATRIGAIIERAAILRRLGSIHERLGNADEAIDAYRKASRTAPGQHGGDPTFGWRLLQARRFEDVVELCDTSAQHGTGRERSAWLEKSAYVLSRHLGRSDAAIVRLQAAIKEDPANDSARWTLVDLLLREERWSKLHEVLGPGDGDPLDALRWAMVAEAVGDVDTARLGYRLAFEGGLECAANPYARLLAQTEQWALLRAFYERREDARSLFHAAEIARTAGEREACVTNLQRCLAQAAAALSPALAYLPWSMGDDGVGASVLQALYTWTSSAQGRAGIRSMLALHHETSGRFDDALAAWQQAFADDPVDPMIVMHLDRLLRANADRRALTETMRRLRDHRQLEAGLRAPVLAAMAVLHEERGMLHEAADTWTAALEAEGEFASLHARIALVRLHRRLGDEDARLDSLRDLASVLPFGRARSQVLREVARSQLAARRFEAAISAYVDALEADPLDFHALRELAELARIRGEEHRLVDSLFRAFEAEERPRSLVEVGALLAAVLIRVGRIEAARQVIDRVRAIDDRSLRPAMLEAELYLHDHRWRQAAQAHEAIAAHTDADDRTRLAALIRAATARADGLSEVDHARRIATQLTDERFDAVDVEHRRLELFDRLGAAADAVTVLQRLLGSGELPIETARAYKLRLATLQEEALGDTAAAIRTLGEVGGAQAAQRLVSLGEKTERWDIVSEALESALESDEEMDPEWLYAVRLRLARILEGPLSRLDAAVRQFRHLVELRPDRPEAWERLLALDRADPARQAAYVRRLIELDPQRTDRYHALREACIEAGDLDTAFCAEAVLEGLAAATDEETYFYRQRRAELPLRPPRPLSRDDLDVLGPDLDEPLVQLACALDPIVGLVFPIDLGAYGIDRASAPSDGRVVRQAQEIARAFGVPRYALHFVPDDVGPCTEADDTPLVMLPASLQHALVREQQFVLGALFCRLAFGATLADPLRANSLSTAGLGAMLEAALELLCDREPSSSGPIYMDIRRRLSNALASIPETGVRNAAQRVPADVSVDGAAVLRAMNAASLRAAILLAQDPAVALSCLSKFQGMFGSDPRVDVVLEATAFAVSADHTRLRTTMAIGLAR